jgi:hypothetical protein
MENITFGKGGTGTVKGILKIYGCKTTRTSRLEKIFYRFKIGGMEYA